MHPPIIVTYIAFVVAALIFIWAALEISSRLLRRKNIDARTTWIKLDATHPEPTQATEASAPLLSEDDEQEEEKPEQNLHLRAQQNGHYSESRKPL